MRSARRWQLCTNLAPARLVAGMRIEHLADDFRSMTVALSPRGFRSATTVHTGAALYAMVDPCLVPMVQHTLGADFLVWERAGSIEVVAPGRGRVWARLELQDDDLRHMRQMTEAGDKHLHLFAVDIRDGEGMAVARVEKMIYVRRKGSAI